MPIHFNDLDIESELKGLKSVLIVPCYLCPAVTVAVREEKPFIQFFRNFMKSAPFDDYLKKLKSRFEEMGLEVKLYESKLIHEWFMCMWTSGRRNHLQAQLENYDAIVVLGCESATETVNKMLKDSNCRLIEGLEVAGIMNAQLKFRLPCDFSFENSSVVPTSKEA